MADENDLDILAWTMLGEAAGEGTQGMADVGHVILNRLDNGRYGSTISEVAKADRQFSTWNSGEGGNNPTSRYPKDSPEFKRARELAAQVVAGTVPGPPGRPLDYHAPSVSPYWAESKDRYGTVVRNGHVFYPSVPVPPGELPEVGTARSTTRTAPVPATPSVDMAQMRRISAPSQLIPETFGSLNRPPRNLGDELAMSPVMGGRQQAPLFDAGFDTRTDTMRLFSAGPQDTQGVFTAASRPPAPVPATQSPQLAATRARDPSLQAALNARYPAQLPPLPPPSSAPTTRRVATTTVRPSPSDLVRGNPMQTRNVATTVASIPTVPQLTASDRARGRSGISTIAQIPTTSGVPTTAQILNGTGFRGGGPVTAPDRLTAGILPPSLFGGAVAGVGTNAIAPIPFTRPAQVAAIPRIAPVPFQRPTAVGTALSVMPRVAPVPFARPNFGMGGPLGRPPVAPIPARMSPAMAARRAPSRGSSGGGYITRPPSSGYGSQGYSTVVSSGGHVYDATTGTWVSP